MTGTRLFRYAKGMDDPKFKFDEKKLQEKIAAEFEKMTERESPNLSLRLLDPVAEMFNFAHDIQVQLSARAAEAQRMVGQLLANARDVATTIADSISEASARFKEAIGRSAHIAKLGWTLDPNSAFPDVLHLSKLTSRADADAYMLKRYEEGDPALEKMEGSLRRNHLVAPFDTVLEQCFDAFRRGHYAICISNLMNILEGVASELDPPHISSTDLQKMLRKGGSVAKRAEQDMFTAAIWLSIATFVDDLYRSCPPPVISGSNSPVLSRHLTQHGRKEPPNEKIEVIRLLHALETALSLHRELGTSLQMSVKGDSSPEAQEPGAPLVGAGK